MTATETTDETGRTTARILLEIEAVHFRPDNPFILTSGRASPVYIDCRKIISFPRARRKVVDMAVETIERGIGFEALDAVAGGETAGIPYAAWIAERLGLPMLYVRKKPKGFGRDAQIEGDFREGSRIVLVEDLSTDGRSKIRFCEALRAAGLTVEHTFVIFHYDIFPETKQTLKDYGLTMHALATWWDVLKVARDRNYFEADTLREVEAFLHNPMEWSASHGGASTFPS